MCVLQCDRARAQASTFSNNVNFPKENLLSTHAQLTHLTQAFLFIYLARNQSRTWIKIQKIAPLKSVEMRHLNLRSDVLLNKQIFSLSLTTWEIASDLQI